MLLSDILYRVLISTDQLHADIVILDFNNPLQVRVSIRSLLLHSRLVHDSVRNQRNIVLFFSVNNSS